MFDVVTSKELAAQPFAIPWDLLGNSKRENTPINEIIKRRTIRRKLLPHSKIFLETDVSSVFPRLEPTNETYPGKVMPEEEIAKAIISQDLVVKMSPKSKHRMTFKVRKIHKGKPRKIQPDELFEIEKS